MLLWWLSIECFSVASTFVGSRLPMRLSDRSIGTVAAVVVPGHLAGVVGDNPRKVRPGAGPLAVLRAVHPDKLAAVSA